MVLLVEAQLSELKLNNDIDADADHQPFCRWSLHRLDQCGFYHLQNRGHPYLMERGVKRHCWCWWDISSVCMGERLADLRCRTCTCSVLWHI